MRDVRPAGLALEGHSNGRGKDYHDLVSLGIDCINLKSATGDWFSDVVRHAYDESLAMMDIDGVDAVFLCAGALRGDTTYGPGE